MDFLISKNKFHFLISRIKFFDIKKWILYIRNQILDIKKYRINSKTVPQNTFIDIKKSISWYQKMISWYQECDFWYQEMCIISWYQEIDFLISRNRILDIRKCISWYQEMYFLISRNRILDIKKCWINSKTAPYTFTSVFIRLCQIFSLFSTN